MKKKFKKQLGVLALAAILTGGNMMSSLAWSYSNLRKVISEEGFIPSEDEEEMWDDDDDATPSNVKKATNSNTSLATSSDAKEDIFAHMPEIGTKEFEKWFFINVNRAALWDWVLELLELKSGPEYEAFFIWYTANEAKIDEAYHKYLGMATRASSTGDMWTGWRGDTNLPGSGTEAEPYQISSISQLMGFSELVAAGQSFEGAYIELVNDIDLGNLIIGGGNWNPIGWYQNKAELAGSVKHPFKGHFDGCGNSIYGLNIFNSSLQLQNVGLFGHVEGGSIRNLSVESDYVIGADNVGVLAGSITGSAIIYNVTVTGYVAAQADAGGIAGEVTGSTKRVTIENCTADGIVIYSEGNTGFVGGIAGNVQNAYLVDNVVHTYDGDSNRIYGKGYVGGIAGRINKTDIYNSYVSGTIGGNGSKAIGGIAGKYESGNLVLARFAGDISRSNNGTASREGTFVGTRDSNHNFTYGTGNNNNLSYLFTDSASKTKTVFGSNIDGDNTFSTAAHIGYWGNNEKKYTLVAGKNETGSGDRYLYEELESGVKYIVTQKLGKEFTSSGYYQGLDFKLDHFAPGYQGEPVRGYLVSVPRIDAMNANGTYDTDIAILTALPTGTNSFYRTIDKDNASAVAAGATITITTAPKNTAGNRYQMVYDESEPGKVNAPTYLDELQNVIPCTYQNGGTYTFIMPENDTEITVEYVKVTTELSNTPDETTITVTHTRTGDRKDPSVTTEVKNEAGILIARYIDGVPDTSIEVQPVAVHVEHNQTGGTVDKSVKWAVDDSDLITNLSEPGYTLTDAKVMPNLNSSFIQSIITREIQAQADAGYKNKIGNTIYFKNAVLTASSNQETSVDHKFVYGNTKLTVAFQIVDNTTIRVEGMELNRSHVVYTVTRTLKGDRLNPEESYICSQPIILTATLNPNQPFFKNVSWNDKESGKIITLNPAGDWTQDCTVSVRFDAEGKQNPVWIQNIINADNQKRVVDKYARINGSASYKEEVIAVSEDQTHGHISAICDITINFVTVDETVIHPESVVMSKEKVNYNLENIKEGDINSKTKFAVGFEMVDLDCTVRPDITIEDIHEPFDRSITWSVSDPDVLLIDPDGKIIPNKNAEWIRKAQLAAPYKDTQTVYVYATANDNGKVGMTEVNLSYETHCVELEKETETIEVELLKTGSKRNQSITWKGTEPRAIRAKTYPDTSSVIYSTSNDAVFLVDDNGTITPVIDTEKGWAKEGHKYPYTATATATLAVTDGTSTDTCVVTVRFKLTDTTTSSSGSGGGGGGSSKGTTTAGTKTAVNAPSNSVTGEWIRTADEKWIFVSGGRTYANEWAYIHNPYAETNQPKANWFRFSAESYMVSGWYQENDKTYYLNPLSDNTQGRMITGWIWQDIDNDGILECYYFDLVSGVMCVNSVTPDGYQVNGLGQWIVEGVIQKRQN